MKIAGISADRFDDGYDCLIVGLDSSGRLGSVAESLDQSQKGWLDKAVSRGLLDGKLLEMTLLPSPLDVGPQSFLVIGTGEPDEIDGESAYRIGSAATRRLCGTARSRIAFAAGDLVPPKFHQALIAGAIAGTVGQGLHQKEPTIVQPEEIVFLGVQDADVEFGQVIGEAVNRTRYLVNQPPNMIYPESFADYCVELATQLSIGCEIWDAERLEQENCHAILAVGRASTKQPRLVILRYQGAESEKAPIALVGKGVTFDSGGLSIKPTESMLSMKCDMAGAATVVGVISAIASLRLPVNVVGLCGLAENMISGDAYRLGDVIRTRSGKTVEIMNTDAEGRVVLADVLDVACDMEPDAIVDLATLTGACVVALGNDVCGLFSNDSELAEGVRVAAEMVGEPLWEMPMFDFFSEQIRSKVADIKNTGEGRWGGAITAAKFLEEFVRSKRWVHLDIAGPAFAESPKPYRDAGATGVMVRTLVRWLQNVAEQK